MSKKSRALTKGGETFFKTAVVIGDALVMPTRDALTPLPKNFKKKSPKRKARPQKKGYVGYFG